jgi:hypothetical protein
MIWVSKTIPNGPIGCPKDTTPPWMFICSWPSPKSCPFANPPLVIPPLGHLLKICTHICIKNWTITNLTCNGNNNEIKKYRIKGFTKVVKNASFISNRLMSFLLKLACFKACGIANLLMMWDIFLVCVAT